MSITMHGKFWEVRGMTDGINLSFDRTLIVAPAPQGSRAQQAGWSASIVSDLLHVRNFTSSERSGSGSSSGGGMNVIGSSGYGGGSGPSNFGGGGFGSTGGGFGGGGVGLPADQAQAVQKLSFVTNLLPLYAKQCLETTNWDYQAALNKFYDTQRNGGISPDMLSQG
jgi:hypothetical protein